MSHLYTHRQFLILPTYQLSAVNFDDVLETSPSTTRRSINGLKTFVKWDSEQVPAFVSQLTDTEGPYTYEEINTILATSEWIVAPTFP